MERLGDRLGQYYSTWLASSISCCLPRLQEQPVDDDLSEFEPPPEKTENQTKRQSPIPSRKLDIGFEATPANVYMAVSKYNSQISQVTYQQPLRQSRLSWPEIDLDEASPQHRSRHLSQEQVRLSKDRRSLVSRASRRARSLSRPQASQHSRRPTIGNPTDFRRSDASQFSDLPVDLVPRSTSPPMRKLSPFRPLQLSIYIPGNELPSLPKFSDDFDDEELSIPGLERPPMAVLKPRSDSLLVRSSTSFSVPRKPVPSRASSTEPLRYSIDSQRTYTDGMVHQRSFSFERMRPYNMDKRPSFATTRSNQEFLEGLNAPLPPLPQPATGTQFESGCAIYRRASEQSLRLRTHLEERQILERKLPEFETISEERSPVSPLSIQQSSPILQHDPQLEAERQIYVQQTFQQRESIHPIGPTTTDPVSTVPTENVSRYSSCRSLQARSSSDSSTLLNEKLSETAMNPIIPTVTTTISVPNSSHCSADHATIPAGTIPSTLNTGEATENISLPEENSLTLRDRLSQWLTRSLTTNHSHLRSRRPSVAATSVSRSPSSALQKQSGRRWHDVHSAPNELADPWDLLPAPLTISKGGMVSYAGSEYGGPITPNSMRRSMGTTVTMKKIATGPKVVAVPAAKGGRPRAHTHGSSVSTYVTTRGLSIDLEKFPIPVVKDVGVAI